MLLNPWALFFLVAAGAPVIVHFLTRPRPTPLPYSTLRFVREIVQQRKVSHRLRDLLTLLMRTVAVVLIVLAMSRPKVGQQPFISQEDDSATVRVVLLDNSQSLAAVEKGTELFEVARATSAEQLSYRPNLRANLILAAAWPRPVFDQPSQNFDALRDALARATCRPERLDVVRALTMAAEMLAPRDANDQRARELVIVSDFQRSNWAQADFSVLPKETKIQMESVAPKSALANIGIAGIRVVGQTAEQGGGRIEVDIGNWSRSTQAVTVEVEAGSVTRRLTAECPAGRQTTISDEFSLPELGWQTGVARLISGGDALSADDQMSLAVFTRPRRSYLLLTRQPASLRPSSSHFLQCALVPEETDSSSAGSPQIVRVAPDQLDAEMLSKADLIVIDHPGSLNPAIVQMLAGAMRRGRPVLYVTAESADATTLQRLSTELGRGLRMPVTYQPWPQGQQRRDQSLTTVRHDSRPFNILGEGGAVMARNWRFGGGLLTHPVPEAFADDLLATYNDGSAFLTFSLTDTASLAVMNADLGSSNLPSQAAFVPLIDELTQQLMEPRTTLATSNSGQPLVVRLPVTGVTADSLEIVGPDGSTAQTDFGELQNEGGGVIWRWPVMGSTGVYRVRQGNDTVFALAITAPAEESQLDALSADVLENRLAAGNQVFYRAATDSDQPRDPWWAWLTVGCLACLFGELATLMVFRT